VKFLPPGKYKVLPKEKTKIESASNGHMFVWRPKITASSDGERVTFYGSDGKLIWWCNSIYALNNFRFSEIEKEGIK
jgi:hypothetical protein